MGAVLSQLGDALRRIFLATIGRPVLQYEKVLDSNVESVSSKFDSLQSILDSFGVGNIPGAGHAIGDLGHSITQARHTVDDFINLSVNAAFGFFVWLVAAGIGALAVAEG